MPKVVTQEERKARLCSAIKKYEEETDKYFELIKTKSIKELKECLEWAKESSIDDFYSDYEAKRYKRTGNLKNAIHIKANKDGKFKILFDSKKMKSYVAQDADYVFENSFMEGYHGGVDFPINGYHPDEGTPWIYIELEKKTKLDGEEVMVAAPFSDYTHIKKGSNKKPKNGRWIKWIKPAEKTTPPREYMIQKVNESIDELQEKYQKMIDDNDHKMWNKYVKKYADDYMAHR